MAEALASPPCEFPLVCQSMGLLFFSLTVFGVYIYGPGVV